VECPRSELSLVFWCFSGIFYGWYIFLFPSNIYSFIRSGPVPLKYSIYRPICLYPSLCSTPYLFYLSGIHHIIFKHLNTNVLLLTRTSCFLHEPFASYTNLLLLIHRHFHNGSISVQLDPHTRIVSRRQRGHNTSHWCLLPVVESGSSMWWCPGCPWSTSN